MVRKPGNGRRQVGVAFVAGIMALFTMCTNSNEVHSETGRIIQWYTVESGEWIAQVPYNEATVGLTYSTLGVREKFTVSLPCPNLDRSFRVTWQRGDDFGVSPFTCEGTHDKDYPLDELELFFTDLPGEAPPAKPAEIFREVDDGKTFV